MIMVARVYFPPRPNSVAASAGSDQLPDGWTRVDYTLSSGRVIPHFYGPDGQYSRSMVGARRQASAGAPSASVVCTVPAAAASIAPAVSSSAPAAAVAGNPACVSVALSTPAVSVPSVLGGATLPLPAPSARRRSGTRKSSSASSYVYEEVSPISVATPVALFAVMPTTSMVACVFSSHRLAVRGEGRSAAHCELCYICEGSHYPALCICGLLRYAPRVRAALASPCVCVLSVALA